MDETRKYAVEVAKEISIAHLNNANSGNAYREVGRDIGEMYEEIFNKVYELLTKANE